MGWGIYTVARVPGIVHMSNISIYAVFVKAGRKLRRPNVRDLDYRSE